jgi:hypothetical protein
MKIKTYELIGNSLDWAVAKCEGGIYLRPSVRNSFWMWPGEPARYSKQAPSYSTDWAQGGPIIEREKIDLLTEKRMPDSWLASVARYQNGKRLIGWRLHQYGPTPLVAAMRCLVASKLGDEIEVPDGLI